MKKRLLIEGWLTRSRRTGIRLPLFRVSFSFSNFPMVLKQVDYLGNNHGVVAFSGCNCVSEVQGEKPVNMKPTRETELIREAAQK